MVLNLAESGRAGVKLVQRLLEVTSKRLWLQNCLAWMEKRSTLVSERKYEHDGVLGLALT